jgi:hypothetical protein
MGIYHAEREGVGTAPPFGWIKICDQRRLSPICSGEHCFYLNFNVGDAGQHRPTNPGGCPHQAGGLSPG